MYHRGISKLRYILPPPHASLFPLVPTVLQLQLHDMFPLSSSSFITCSHCSKAPASLHVPTILFPLSYSSSFITRSHYPIPSILQLQLHYTFPLSYSHYPTAAASLHVPTIPFPLSYSSSFITCSHYATAPASLQFPLSYSHYPTAPASLYVPTILFPLSYSSSFVICSHYPIPTILQLQLRYTSPLSYSHYPTASLYVPTILFPLSYSSSFITRSHCPTAPASCHCQVHQPLYRDCGLHPFVRWSHVPRGPYCLMRCTGVAGYVLCSPALQVGTWGKGVGGGVRVGVSRGTGCRGPAGGGWAVREGVLSGTGCRGPAGRGWEGDWGVEGVGAGQLVTGFRRPVSQTAQGHLRTCWGGWVTYLYMM